MVRTSRFQHRVQSYWRSVTFQRKLSAVCPEYGGSQERNQGEKDDGAAAPGGKMGNKINFLKEKIDLCARHNLNCLGQTNIKLNKSLRLFIVHSFLLGYVTVTARSWHQKKKKKT